MFSSNAKQVALPSGTHNVMLPMLHVHQRLSNFQKSHHCFQASLSSSKALDTNSGGGRVEPWADWPLFWLMCIVLSSKGMPLNGSNPRLSRRLYLLCQSAEPEELGITTTVLGKAHFASGLKYLNFYVILCLKFEFVTRNAASSKLPVYCKWLFFYFR
jgi:hypothetical protein